MPALSAEERLLGLLRSEDSLTIDELTAHSQLDASAIALNLLNLELKGLICSLPGKRYRLIMAS
jgi:DNA processing protein